MDTGSRQSVPIVARRGEDPESPERGSGSRSPRPEVFAFSDSSFQSFGFTEHRRRSYFRRDTFLHLHITFKFQMDGGLKFYLRKFQNAVVALKRTLID